MGAMMTTGSCSQDRSPLLASENELELREYTDDGVGVVTPTTVKVRGTPCYVFTLAFLSAIGGFLFGYDTGVVAGATLPISAKFELTTFEKEVFVSITILAAAIFAIVGGVLNDKLGRKPTTLIASVVFAQGAIVLAAANNKLTLLAGRFILGIGIGISSCTVPIYVSECSPSHLRGRLVTVINLCITAGQFVSCIVDGLFCHADNGWRYMLGLAAVPAILQFFGFLFMPESPRWLVNQGKDQIAIGILRRLRGSYDVSKEYNAIKEACDEEERAKEIIGHQFIVTKVFTNPPIRRAIIIGCLLQLFQQITGINTVMYYSATIIRMGGVEDTCQAIWYASITAFANFIFTFVGIALVERLGRRILLLASLAGVTVSLVFLGIGFQVETTTAPNVTSPFRGKDHCASTYLSCTQCIEDTSCGFCYDTSADGRYVNSSCLPANAHTTRPSYDNCTYSNSTQAMQLRSSWAYDYCPTPYFWMSVLGMILYLACFSPGLGPMPWTINSEIYPLWARGFGNGLATFVNWAANLVISITFLSLSEAITRQGAFYLYASLGVIGFIFFYLFLPETRGHTLEEMEALFSGSWFVGRKASPLKRT